MIYPIRLYGDPVLRRRASPVTDFGPELKTLAQDMIATMYAAEGVGLAAPQIGLSARLFVALEIERRAGGGEDDADAGEERSRLWEARKEHVIVNPVITAREGEQFGPDGCLSVPGLHVDSVRRDMKIRLSYQDLDGSSKELEAEGYFAHVLQHEYDHLEGQFFFDRLGEAERREFLKEYRFELLDMQREAKEFLRYHVASEPKKKRPKARLT